MSLSISQTHHGRTSSSDISDAVKQIVNRVGRKWTTKGRGGSGSWSGSVGAGDRGGGLGPATFALEEQSYLVQLMLETEHNTGAVELCQTILADLQRTSRTYSAQMANLQQARGAFSDMDKEGIKMLEERIIIVLTKQRTLEIEIRYLEAKIDLLQRRNRVFDEFNERLVSLYNTSWPKGLNKKVQQQEVLERNIDEAYNQLHKAEMALERYRFLKALLTQGIKALEAAAKFVKKFKEEDEGVTSNKSLNAMRMCTIQADVVIKQAKFVLPSLFKDQMNVEILQEGWLSTAFPSAKIEDSSRTLASFTSQQKAVEPFIQQSIELIESQSEVAQLLREKYHSAILQKENWQRKILYDSVVTGANSNNTDVKESLFYQVEALEAQLDEVIDDSNGVLNDMVNLMMTKHVATNAPAANPSIPSGATRGNDREAAGAATTTTTNTTTINNISLPFPTTFPLYPPSHSPSPLNSRSNSPNLNPNSNMPTTAGLGQPQFSSSSSSLLPPPSNASDGSGASGASGANRAGSPLPPRRPKRPPTLNLQDLEPYGGIAIGGSNPSKNIAPPPPVPPLPLSSDPKATSLENQQGRRERKRTNDLLTIQPPTPASFSSSSSSAGRSVSPAPSPSLSPLPSSATTISTTNQQGRRERKRTNDLLTIQPPTPASFSSSSSAGRSVSPAPSPSLSPSSATTISTTPIRALPLPQMLSSTSPLLQLANVAAAADSRRRPSPSQSRSVSPSPSPAPTSSSLPRGADATATTSLMPPTRTLPVPRQPQSQPPTRTLPAPPLTASPIPPRVPSPTPLVLTPGARKRDAQSPTQSQSLSSQSDRSSFPNSRTSIGTTATTTTATSASSSPTSPATAVPPSPPPKPPLSMRDLPPPYGTSPQPQRSSTSTSSISTSTSASSHNTTTSVPHSILKSAIGTGSAGAHVPAPPVRKPSIDQWGTSKVASASSSGHKTMFKAMFGRFRGSGAGAAGEGSGHTGSNRHSNSNSGSAGSIYDKRPPSSDSLASTTSPSLAAAIAAGFVGAQPSGANATATTNSTSAHTATNKPRFVDDVEVIPRPEIDSYPYTDEEDSDVDNYGEDEGSDEHGREHELPPSPSKKRFSRAKMSLDSADAGSDRMEKEQAIDIEDDHEFLADYYVDSPQSQNQGTGGSHAK